MPTVFLDGRFIERSDARVSAFDAGFQHGVGLFETMLAVVESGGDRPRVIALWEHLERLRSSASALGLVSQLHLSALAEAVERTAAKQAEASPDTERFRVRLTLTGGDLNLLRGAERREGTAHEPTLLIVAQPATAYPPEMLDKGVMASIADWRVSPLDPMAGHKTLNYWGRLRELQRAAAIGAGESLVFSITNHLVGGCVSNAFLVKNGEISTPIARGEEGGADEPTANLDTPLPDPGARASGALPSPVLPGITRKWAMDWAHGAELRVRARMLTIADVLSADEVFLTNSSWGVLPIVAIETQRVGDGAVGTIASRLAHAWDELIGRGAGL
jgi:branched-subunit amino acid aminotransferase/4-amino-4-deoxychorismate lyase